MIYRELTRALAIL
ncbi:hypothetical protein K1D77_04435 [Escherichia coli]|nr:hypothetical protein [Escherichia coli]MBW8477058.1 hypothetical protein [Escherichia coli]MBW8530318.1 hypothetical protein [Escherichia coli]MBW8578620.1 hypothetical protein [Escherichia coli]MBW8586860.1 hypothetical protein [Escherichia coli]MBW8595949.1 hypothetical protein [Escherichia coli]